LRLPDFSSFDKAIQNRNGSRRSEKLYLRFKTEVKVLRDNNDIEGILPIIDFHLPEKSIKDLPWYVMPVALPLEEHLDASDYEAVVQAVKEIGEILVQLHDRGISHRDIKPANILVWNNKIHLSDFGLAEFPQKSDITSMREQLGAKWTIAPEMQRSSKDADGKPADVYSLSKTLWILLTGKKNGFEGQYNAESINGLKRLKLVEKDYPGIHYFRPEFVYIQPLDDLLTISTNDDPLQRPNIRQFVESLSQWAMKCDRMYQQGCGYLG
jgi:serine/threonine-protein kinase